MSDGPGIAKVKKSLGTYVQWLNADSGPGEPLTPEEADAELSAEFLFYRENIPGITQSWLAKRHHTTVPTVRRYERGESVPPTRIMDDLRKLAALAGLEYATNLQALTKAGAR